jgi:hypothetical protein
MTRPQFDPMPVAVRAYAVPVEEPKETKSARGGRGKKYRPPQRALVFDTETTVDATQRLNIGCWRYYIDRPDALPGTVCVEEGLFFDDDLPERDPVGYGVLRAYVESTAANVFPGHSTRLRLLSRTEFVEQVLYRYGYRNRATVVGFNLPFDLSRLALSTSPSRGRFAGGNSLRLWEEERFRPRIAYKAIDSRRTLMGFTAHDGGDEKFRGHFLDLRTLCFALTDRSYSLETAGAAFGVDYLKRPVAHGSITPDYVTYCREDVEATSQLYRAAIEEYRLHPIDLQPTKAFSPASIGKGYERKMGILPILERQPDFDPSVLGWGMAAYFGGRAECRIRKVPLPVVYVDFLSMYPTVNALMDTWELIVAKRIEVNDSTEAIQQLLAAPDLADQCFDPSFWRRLRCLVELEPDGDILPVRAAYDPAGVDYGIGVNPYRLKGAAWYSLADVVDSVLLSGQVPRIRRAVSLRAVGCQSGLRPISIRGMVEVDPRKGDFFRQVIELRRQVEADPSYSEEERVKLSRFLKVLANATSYGILAEFVRHEVRELIQVSVYSDGGDPFLAKTMAPETPGPYCFPPLAAIITGAARLMLGLLEHGATDLHYTFCDTDSMGMVADPIGGLYECPGGSELLDDGSSAVQALTWSGVDGIVQRFALLNPYDPNVVLGSILKIEKENLDANRNRRQLWCWSISTKRYCLFAREGASEEAAPDGTLGVPVLIKVSEHGLGHLLNPTNPDDTSNDWITEAWNYILRQELGLSVEEPHWLDRPALTRVTASGPNVLRWFKGYNQGRSYGEQIKPANFLLLAHPDPLDQSSALPIAPFESDASKWGALRWIDRRTGGPIAITIDPFDGNERPGMVRVRTYRDVLINYVGHPEAKSLGPDGEPVSRQTVGLLHRRGLESVPPIRRIGKEANRLDDRVSGIVTDFDEYQTEYADPRQTVWSTLVVPNLASMNTAELARQAGLHRRTIERYLSGQATPRPEHEDLLTGIAVEHAGRSITDWGAEVPAGPQAVLYRYAQLCEDRRPVCQGCGGSLTGRQTKWCGEVCRTQSRQK